MKRPSATLNSSGLREIVVSVMNDCCRVVNIMLEIVSSSCCVHFIHTGRYPNHEASKRLESSDEHREELEKLRSAEGDYHHGFHSGVLAASKMFQEHADILHVNEHTVSFEMSVECYLVGG